MSPRWRLTLECTISLAALVVGLWVVDYVLQPIPMPAGTAAVFGWLGYWLVVRRRERACLIGFGLGALAGVGMHVRSHVVEDRVGEIGALVRHVLGDLALSTLAAVLILAIAVGWRIARARMSVRASPRSE